MRNPLRNLIQNVGSSDPLLLAHHPTCEFYDHHTFELYGHKLCMGCFIVYPVSFVSLSTLVILRFLWPQFDLFEWHTHAFYIIGFALIGPMTVSKALPFSRSSRVRITGKVLLAVGLALVAFPFVYRPGFRLLTAGLFVGVLLPYIVHKGLTARDDCRGCPEADEFPDCSGMTFGGEDGADQSDRQ